MPTDWAGVVGFQPNGNACRADGMVAGKAYFNLNGTSLTRECVVFFQAYAATFLGIVYAVVHLEKLEEKCFGHFGICIVVDEFSVTAVFRVASRG